MDGVRSQVIDLIKGEVKERGGQVSFSFSGSDLFDSCPIGIPHGSEMGDVWVDVVVDQDCVEFECDGGEPGGFDWEEEKESFRFVELSLHQLTFILSRL